MVAGRYVQSVVRPFGLTQFHTHIHIYVYKKNIKLGANINSLARNIPNLMSYKSIVNTLTSSQKCNRLIWQHVPLDTPPVRAAICVPGGLATLNNPPRGAGYAVSLRQSAFSKDLISSGCSYCQIAALERHE